MEKYLNKGRLTIRAALYLNSIIISFIMGFSGPVTTQFFMGLLTPQFIATATIVFKIVSVAVAYVKQSKIAIRYISEHFAILMIMCDIVFFLMALIGESYPEIRFVGYNLILLAGVRLLQVVRKDNTCNCLKGTAIIQFNAKCDTYGLVASILGAGSMVLVSNIISISVTYCMILESLFCAIGHWFQYYANIRIKQEIIHNHIRRYSFIEVINDIFALKKSKTSNQDDDSIFDQ